jgi:hypothetical protein
VPPRHAGRQRHRASMLCVTVTLRGGSRCVSRALDTPCPCVDALAELVEQLVASGATDVGHAAKRRFPSNAVIGKCVALLMNEVVSAPGADAKACVIS